MSTEVRTVCPGFRGVTVGLLAAACLLALASPPPATAGTFTALTCHGPSGNAVGTRGWREGTAVGEYISYGADCASGGEGSFGLTMGPDPTGNYKNGYGNTMTYSVPAGLQILSYSLQLHAFGGPCGIQDNQSSGCWRTRSRPAPSGRTWTPWT